jgi:hypothetical protein
VIRSGYGMIWFEQTGITTPFTLPQFPFVQMVGQQSQDNINPAFVLSNGPTVQVAAPNPNSGLGQGVLSRCNMYSTHGEAGRILLRAVAATRRSANWRLPGESAFTISIVP